MLAEANRRAPIAASSDLFPNSPIREPHRGALTVQEPAVTTPASPRDAGFQHEIVDSMLEKITDSTESPVRAEQATATGLSLKRSVPHASAPRRKVEPWPMPLRRERVAK